MKAIWKGAVLAESEDTIVIENNHYFPAASLDRQYFIDSETTSSCSWKGTARYYTISVNGQKNIDAAWYYPDPNDAALELKDRVAFWRGGKVTE